MTTTLEVAQAISAIEKLYADLMAQAIVKACDSLMPGGEAMVSLAPAASPDDWAENLAAAELYHLATCPRLDHTRCRYAEHAGDEDGEEPILQTLLFWSEQWRADLGYSLEVRPTVVSEAAFIRHRIDWAWDHLLEWGDFAKDITSARTRLENLLYAGERAERGAPCIYDRKTLVRKHQPYRDEDGVRRWRMSKWHCPRCHREWDEAEYARMVTAANELTKVERIGEEDWVSVDYAARKVGRPESTVRVWIHRGDIASACIISGRRERFVSLSEVQARHEKARRRKAVA